MALNRRAGCAKPGVLLRKTPVLALKAPKKPLATARAGIPGFFAWRSAKNKPKKIFALRAKNKQKNPKAQKHPQKTPKKHQTNFLRAYARKKNTKKHQKTPKKKFSRLRAKNNHFAWRS